VIEREVSVNKKTRKQRQKQEQSYKATSQQPVITEEEKENQTDDELVNESVNSAIEEIEVWDLDQMKEDYGW
jgi:putative transposase